MPSKKTTPRKRAPGAGPKKTVTEKVERTPSSSFDEGLGMSANLSRLREAEKAAHTDYEDAKKAGMDQNTITSLNFEWLKLSEQLRKAEVAAPSVMLETGMMVKASDVTEAWSSALTKFRVTLESLPRKLPLVLEGKSKAQIQATLQKEVQDALEGMALHLEAESKKAKKVVVKKKTTKGSPPRTKVTPARSPKKSTTTTTS